MRSTLTGALLMVAACGSAAEQMTAGNACRDYLKTYATELGGLSLDQQAELLGSVVDLNQMPDWEIVKRQLTVLLGAEESDYAEQPQANGCATDIGYATISPEIMTGIVSTDPDVPSSAIAATLSKHPRLIMALEKYSTAAGAEQLVQEINQDWLAAGVDPSVIAANQNMFRLYVQAVQINIKTHELTHAMGKSTGNAPLSPEEADAVGVSREYGPNMVGILAGMRYVLESAAAAEDKSAVLYNLISNLEDQALRSDKSFSPYDDAVAYFVLKLERTDLDSVRALLGEMNKMLLWFGRQAVTDQDLRAFYPRLIQFFEKLGHDTSTLQQAIRFVTSQRGRQNGELPLRIAEPNIAR